MKRYRIVTVDEKYFELQERFLWYWIRTYDTWFQSVEHAEEAVARLKSIEAREGKVVKEL